MPVASVQTNQTESAKSISLESVQRVSKIPVVESTINVTSNIYGKVKSINPVMKYLLGTAEQSVYLAVEMAQPIASRLETPIKKADSMMCSTLDFVEANVPTVKQPTLEVCVNTVSHCVNTASQCANTVSHYAGTISQIPVQPALDRVKAVSSYGIQKATDVYTNVQNKRKENVFSEGVTDAVSEEIFLSRSQSLPHLQPYENPVTVKRDQSTQTVEGNVKSKQRYFEKYNV